MTTSGAPAVVSTVVVGAGDVVVGSPVVEDVVVEDVVDAVRVADVVLVVVDVRVVVVLLVVAESTLHGSKQPPWPSSCMSTWNSEKVEVLFSGVYQPGLLITPKCIAQATVS
mmetsp:Transcript_86110/g.240975  ORF Transcript_86110/g.240975 Transcript_86110/m.240975 type:complete len:112 (+) Transcript_86110:1260-1595(+)